MCGIAGVLSRNTKSVRPEVLEAMVQAIRHRGPDSIGIHGCGKAGSAALGHARLSIIDPSNGHQPMSNADGTLWITFNGEIFNYVELREELLRKGRRFSTQSDTEVILHMYEEAGEACVQRFNGQWAFAIWDVPRRKLFLSRDRLGIRPLFYARVDSDFVFASEIKAVLTHPGVARSIDLEALDQVFTFWNPLPPRTMFKHIHELPPGHCMTVGDGEQRIWPYWRLDYSSIDPSMTEDEGAERLLEILSDATRIRLRSDVPVGAYLSGGLDSSVITALVRNCQSPLRTFSVTFEDSEFDEAPYQQDVVDLLGTDHRSVRCSNLDIARVFPDVVWHAEKPVLRTAPAPFFLLSRLVRDEGYKVVLTGEGSDEFLGGYDIFKEAKIRRFWAADASSPRRPLLLKRLYPYLQSLQSQSESYLKAFFHVRPSDLANPFFSHLPRWELTSRLKVFLSDGVRAELGGRDSYSEMRKVLPDQYPEWDGFSQAQYLEAVGLLPGYILSSQGDRMAMAHSVEGRFPFLDYRLVEFANTIPPHLKMKVLNEKYLLKHATGHMVPSSVQTRCKQPYRAPDADSFFDAATGTSLMDYVDELLGSERLQRDGLFSPSAVGMLTQKARSGRIMGVKDNMALVGILSTQLLVDQFINNGGRRMTNGGY